MALRFRRSIKIAPGLRVNLGKTGVSMSMGVRGATITAGSKGVYGNVGMPGTGLSYRTKLSGASGATANLSAQRSVEEKLGLTQLEAEAVALNDDISRVLLLHLECKKPNDPVVHTPMEYIEPRPSPASGGKLVAFLIWMFGAGLLAQPLPESAQGAAMIVAGIAVYLGWRRWRDNKTSQQLAAWEEQKAAWERQEQAEVDSWNQRATDTKRREEFLGVALGSVDWPRETTFSFEFKTPQRLALDVDLPEVEDMPKSYWAVRKSGASLEQKERSDTQIRKDYARHIHAICLLSASVAFWAVPELTELVISGYTQRPSKATGVIQDDYILSVCITREGWERIDFDALERVDPFEALAVFDLRLDMSKTCVLKPIEPFT